MIARALSRRRALDPTLRTHGDVNIIEVEGKMTFGSRETDETGGMIRDLLHAGRKRILLNLEKVSYIDSASLGMLVAHFKRAAERGAAVKLLRPSEKTLAVLVTARLDLVFEIFQDETEAIASF